MNTKRNIMPYIFDMFLSEETRAKAEKIILKLALFSFFIHLAVIYLIKFDFLAQPLNSELKLTELLTYLHHICRLHPFFFHFDI